MIDLSEDKKKIHHDARFVLLIELVHNQCMSGNCANPSCGKSWHNDGIMMSSDKTNSQGLHADSNSEGFCDYCNDSFQNLDN